MAISANKIKKVLYKRKHNARNSSGMLKTKKSISKRFKLSASGKVLRRSAGYGHLLRNKSVKRQRNASIDKQVSPGFSAQVKRAMPFA